MINDLGNNSRGPRETNLEVMRKTQKGFWHSSSQTNWNQLLYNNVSAPTIRFRKMFHIRLWPTLHMRGISKFYIKPRKISVWRGALRHNQQILWQHRTEHSKLSGIQVSIARKCKLEQFPKLSTTWKYLNKLCEIFKSFRNILHWVSSELRAV